jgi:hypothetical protein
MALNYYEVNIQIYVCVCVCVCVGMPAEMLAGMCMYVYLLVWTFPYVYSFVHVLMYIHPYICIHACRSLNGWLVSSVMWMPSATTLLSTPRHFFWIWPSAPRAKIGIHPYIYVCTYIVVFLQCQVRKDVLMCVYGMFICMFVYIYIYIYIYECIHIRMYI